MVRKSKNTSMKKKKEMKERKHKGAVSEEELETEIEDIEDVLGEDLEEESQGEHHIEASKPIAQLNKGDKIKIDSKEYEVDTHYVLIDHGTTKEMAIELFDFKTNKDYQLRYFNDQAEDTLELYELQDIMYFKKPFKKISW